MEGQSLLCKIKEEEKDDMEIKQEEINLELVKVEENYTLDGDEESELNNELETYDDSSKEVKDENDEGKLTEFISVQTVQEEVGDWSESRDYNQDPLAMYPSPEIKIEPDCVEDDDATEAAPSMSQELDTLCCRWCGSEFAILDQLEEHRKICSHIDTSPSSANDLTADSKVHAIVQSGEKPYKCTQCNYSGAKSIYLKRHMRVHSDIKPYKCTECNYSTTKAYNLKVHLRIHSGEKPYKCPRCNYSAATTHIIKVHMRIHSGDKRFKCSLCNYSAAKSNELKAHISVHSGGRPHKCPQCDYSAAKSNNLKVHMRIHSGEKPYKCTQCVHSAGSLSNLKTHMRVHSGEKPYKCTECNYSAAESCSLNRHMRNHFVEEPYKCTECNYSARRLTNVKLHHMRIHSSENQM